MKKYSILTLVLAAMLMVPVVPVSASPPNIDVWDAEWVGNAPNRDPNGLVTRTFRVTPEQWAAGTVNTTSGLATTSGAVTVGVTPLHRLPAGVSSAPPSTPLGASVNDAGVLSGPITITLVIAAGVDEIGAVPPQGEQWYVAVDIGTNIPNVGPVPNHASHVHVHLPAGGYVVNAASGGSSGCNSGFAALAALALVPMMIAKRRG